MNREFADYEKIVLRLAWKFAPSLREDVQDLLQEGYIRFMELVKEEERKGLNCSFESALYTHIRQNWINEYQKKQTQKRKVALTDISDLVEVLGYNPFDEIDKYLSLSDQAIEVVTIIYTAPMELIEMLKLGGGFKPCLIKYLKDCRGWDEIKVEEFFAEIPE